MFSAALLLGAAVAAPRDAALPRLDAPLRQAAAQARKGSTPHLARALPEIADPSGVLVTLEVDAAAPPPAWPVQARAQVSPDTAWVQVRVPWPALPSLEAVPGLQRARLPHLAREKEGERGDVVSEGLDAIFRDGDWLEAGLDGRRVDVVVADVGFAGAVDLGEELPRNTRMSHSENIDATAHGTAVTEVVGDLAPRVRVRLKHFTTGVAFLELMEDLAGERRAELVNGSIGFDNVWAADGTSPYTKAVDALPEAGALWVGAAGNEGGRYLAGALAEDQGELTIAGMPGTWVPVVEGTAEASLRWSEPMRGARVDLDLVAYAEDGTPCGRADDPQDGGSSAPTETLVASCPGDAAWVAVVRGTDDADITGLTAWLYGPWGVAPSVVEDGLGVLTLPADTRTGLAVGACDRDADAAPAYSSWGPTEDGRTKPDLCAHAEVSTASYGTLGFVGTSAATPHVTGFAALVAQGDRLRGEPDALREAVLARTVDLGDPGQDDTFGAGALDAGPAPEGCHCASGGGAAGRLGWLGLGLGALLVVRRRGVAPRVPPRSPDMRLARGGSPG